MRVIAVDWSGAARHEEHHLRVAEVDGESGRAVSVVAATRVEAVDVLMAAADADPAVVAGLDFGFSLPAWWLEACGIGSVDELWADDARLEGWLAGCAPPFWGRSQRPRPRFDAGQEYRLTELAAPRRPRSMFQIGGAGAVGTGSLRGMPHLARLRAAGYSVWPWDPWRPPVVAEVWPRLAIGALVKSSPAARAAWATTHSGVLPASVVAAVGSSDDALDAMAAALHLAGGAGEVPPRPGGRRVALEGWIWRVDIPGDVGRRAYE